MPPSSAGKRHVAGVFDHAFVVAAPLGCVAAFHSSPAALQQLTPPPILVRLRAAGPLVEGMVADFTLWFGPIPVGWQALHTEVQPDLGFVDTQVRGPMAYWRHTHTFEPDTAGNTIVRDRVEYSHPAGPRGWLTRLVFGRAALGALFSYRAWATRRAVRRACAQAERG